MSRLTRDGTAEPVSRDQILRRERGQGNNHFTCSADHVQYWQPYPVDPYSCYMCDLTYKQVLLSCAQGSTATQQISTYHVQQWLFGDDADKGHLMVGISGPRVQGRN